MKCVDYLSNIIESNLYRKLGNALFTVFLVSFFLLSLFDIMYNILVIVGFIGFTMIGLKIISEEIDDLLTFAKKYI